MASEPTYQPSIFVGRPDPKKLAPLLNATVAQRDNYPGLNRAIDAAYPPGSTFKPVTALAAMQEHILNPYDLLPCTPTFTAYKQVFHNWTPLIDTGMNLTTALAESCDTYFYEVGRRFYVLPPDRGHPLQAGRGSFGLGAKTGIDLVARGQRPDPGRRRGAASSTPGRSSPTLDRTWKPGYSIQLAIGQGQVLVTPLQMARLYALIANGGKLVTPHVGRRRRADRPERPARAGAARASPRSRRRPSASTRSRCVTCSRASTRRRTRRSARRRACSAASRSRSPARRAAPRSSCTCPATRTR